MAALVTPATAQIATNIIVQLEAALSQTIPLLPKGFSRVLAKVLGGVFVTIYKYAGSSLLQQFVSTASMDETLVNGIRIRPLVEWGRLGRVGDPLGATQAELVVTVTVLTQTGSLPGGAQLLHAATGVVYQTVAAVPLDAATVTVTARASSDQTGGDGSGTVGNLEPGQVLQFASPLANVARAATVTGMDVQGAAGEAEDVYRSRVVARYQRRPQGGAYADYQQWGSAVAGIRAVFPYTGAPGEVDVYVEAVDGDGVPSEAQLDAVLDAINYDPDEFPSPTGLANRRPANAAVNVLPIARTAFDVEIAGLEATGAADAETVLAEMSEGLGEFFLAREPFIVGLSALPRLDRVTQGAVAGVVNEIAEANGASVATVILRRAGVSIQQYALAHGELAVLGTLTPI
jgi:phage-related baseplate assembly protein